MVSPSVESVEKVFPLAVDGCENIEVVKNSGSSVSSKSPEDVSLSTEKVVPVKRNSSVIPDPSASDTISMQITNTIANNNQDYNMNDNCSKNNIISIKYKTKIQNKI